MFKVAKRKSDENAVFPCRLESDEDFLSALNGGYEFAFNRAPDLARIFIFFILITIFHDAFKSRTRRRKYVKPIANENLERAL